MSSRTSNNVYFSSSFAVEDIFFLGGGEYEDMSQFGTAHPNTRMFFLEGSRMYYGQILQPEKKKPTEHVINNGKSAGVKQGQNKSFDAKVHGPDNSKSCKYFEQINLSKPCFPQQPCAKLAKQITQQGSPC